MPFKKGNSGNPNGRPQGAKGKKTELWEELGRYFVEDGAERVKKIMSKSSDKEFLMYYDKLLEYFKPKLQRTEVKAEISMYEMPNNSGLGYTFDGTPE